MRSERILSGSSFDCTWQALGHVLIGVPHTCLVARIQSLHVSASWTYHFKLLLRLSVWILGLVCWEGLVHIILIFDYYAASLLFVFVEPCEIELLLEIRCKFMLLDSHILLAFIVQALSEEGCSRARYFFHLIVLLIPSVVESIGLYLAITAIARALTFDSWFPVLRFNRSVMKLMHNSIEILELVHAQAFRV